MIRFPYALIDQLIIEDGIRILSPKDITPTEMLEWYTEKFPHTDTTFLLRSLV
jgi:hypothetical protein